jgi:hypothetical protein
MIFKDTILEYGPMGVFKESFFTVGSCYVIGYDDGGHDIVPKIDLPNGSHIAILCKVQPTELDFVYYHDGCDHHVTITNRDVSRVKITRIDIPTHPDGSVIVPELRCVMGVCNVYA